MDPSWLDSFPGPNIFIKYSAEHNYDADEICIFNPNDTSKK